MNRTMETHVPNIILRNATLIDGESAEARPGTDVLVEAGIIREVADRPLAASGAQVVDLGGRALMPGLIDCHVHVIAASANLGQNAAMPNSLVAAHAARIMEGMLARGFTSVRDAGGADHGLVLAQEAGLIRGPRLFISGKALTQTGGHADYRGRFDRRQAETYPDRLGALGRVADGVSEVRRAAREEIKAGARYIKIMANGGIASPTDPIHFFGYSREEIRAAVEEAEAAGTYVLAHLYTDDAIRRAVECGVRSIEHGNLVTPDTARMMKEAGAFVVPTLVTFDALSEEGATLGLPPDSVAKIDAVRSAGLRSLEIFRDAGVPMGYGTDLLGDMHRHQSREFAIRAQVLSAHEVIASATSVAARILGMEGKAGVVRPGALADMIVVEGNPLKDVSLLATGIRAVMQGGVFVQRPSF
jgi:imidazolonepropionase-like amidohydrolase